jgi:hypothetical protein
MSKEEVIAFLNDMIDALTWKRAGLILLFGAFTVLLLMLFENRTTIFNRLVDHTPVEELSSTWEISEQSKKELINTTRIPLVGAVLLSEADLKKNRRITKFWHVSDPTLRQQVVQVMASVLPQAFFDTDHKNNEQMLAVLNNQFVCTPSTETLFIRFFPDITKTYPVVCRLAVPPFSGHFAGIITIFLTKTPTPTEVDSLKIEITRVSVELYLRDIQNR